MNEYRALEEDAMFTLAENPKVRKQSYILIVTHLISAFIT